MIPVDTVLNEQLPVRAHAVCLCSSNNLHAFFSLITDEIQVFFSTG